VHPRRSLCDGLRMTSSDEQHEHLEVTIAGRETPAAIALPAGESLREELARFLNRQGPYAQLWIKLASGEYVRYDAIVSVAPSPRFPA
jgi:hypothetical protein